MTKRTREEQFTLFDQCRTFGHAWFEIDADKQSPIGFYIWLKCDRCDMIRMDTVSLRGNLTARSYRQPAGYALSEKVTRADFRMKLYKSRPKNGRRTAA